MEIHIESAVTCSELLLELTGIKLSKDIVLPSGQPIDARIKALNKCYGVRLKQKKLKYAALLEREIPLAFLSPDGVYRILAKINQTHCLIQHPLKSHSEVWSREQLSNNWSGKVIVLSDRSLKFNWSWFIPAFWEHRRMLTEILCFSFVLQLLALILPLFFQVIMDKVLVYKAYNTLDVLVFGLVVTGIFEALLRGFREYQYSHTTKRIDILLGIKLVKHLLGLPLLYFKHRPVGSLVARVSQLDSIRSFLSGALFSLLVDIAFMNLFLVVMWVLAPALTTIAIVSIPFYILIAWRMTKPLQAKLEKQFQFSAANTAFLTESIAGAETVKSLAVEPRLAQRWEIQTRDLVGASYRTQVLSSLSHHTVEGIGKLTSLLILWYGAGSVINLEITTGQLIAFNMLYQNFSLPLSKLVELWGSVRSGSSSSRMERPPSPTSRMSAMAISILVLLGFIWAFWGELDIHATAHGQLVLPSRSQLIQPYELSKVVEILVKDGAHVKAGDKLLVLNIVGSAQEMRRCQEQKDFQALELARYSALLSDQPLKNLCIASDIEESMAARAKAHFTSTWQEYQTMLNKFDTELSINRSEQIAHQTSIKWLQKLLHNIAQRLASSRKLAQSKNLSSGLDLL